MPKNREALIRYRVINRLLVNRKYASLQEMTEACEEALDKSPLSLRTLRQDLFDLKNNRQLGYYAPIEYDHAERAYHYTDRSYSIDRLPLTDEEIDALAFAGRMLEQFKGSEPFDQIEGAVDKILQHLKIRKEVSAQEFRNFIDFEKSTVTKGSEYIEILINALKKKQVILITHKPFYEEIAFKTSFHPYLLKEYRNRWYIFGYSEHHKEPRTFAIDRIQKIDPAPLKTFIEPKFPPRDYFSNIIGINRKKGSKAEKVIIKLSRFLANYILTQPLHDSQKTVEETNEYVIISLDIHDSPDLYWILLGWGNEVEVLEPVSLREIIRKIHEQSAVRYRGKPIVYFDMDGVLVDFQSGVDQLSEEAKRKYKGFLDEVPGIFSLMKPLQEGIEAFKRISEKYECFVLTTAPWKNPTAPSDKREWLKFHLGESVHKRLVISHRKDLNCGSYLIDDNPKNGASEFQGKWIYFGSKEFPDWGAVLNFLKVQ